MSNLNDLIHTNAVVAFQQGVKTEQNRIIKLLENADSVCSYWAIELIKRTEPEEPKDE